MLHASDVHTCSVVVMCERKHKHNDVQTTLQSVVQCVNCLTTRLVLKTETKEGHALKLKLLT